MTSIDPSQRLAALLHNEVAALRERQAAQSRAGSSSAERGGLAPKGLAAVLMPRIAAIDKDAPDRKQRAFRVFLETTLLQELGPALIRDAAFTEMVDAVQSRMLADAQLAAAADELGALLASGRALAAE